MLYLTRMIGKPVVDDSGETVGRIADLAMACGDVFPRITSLAVLGPDKKPLMISWRKFVKSVDESRAVLQVSKDDLRFSFLQPDEIMLAGDLLHRQIVDTQGAKLVRVNDLKLAETRGQLRLLGAEIGARGLLSAFSPRFEAWIERALRPFGWQVPEDLIAWNYIDLIDRDLSRVQLSVTHKRLSEMHPADVADLLEELSPVQRAKVFEYLDTSRAAEALSELEDDIQPQVLGEVAENRATAILTEMDPDDAADLIADLPQDKAEKLLQLMGVRESRQIRHLMGYDEKTAGGIMTPEVTTVSEDMTVQEVIDHLRGAAAENESIYYIYVVDPKRTLKGVVSLRDLIIATPDSLVSAIVERDLFTVEVDDDQQEVAEMMSKYDLLALPVVDVDGKLLGIVTVDDALEVMEEESAEDMTLVTGAPLVTTPFEVRSWFGSTTAWISVWFIFGLGMSAVAFSQSSLLASFVAVVLFIPLVMRLSDDIASHAIASLIETGELTERPRLWNRLLGDLAAGLVIGVFSALIAMFMLQIFHERGILVVPIGLAVALTVLLLVLVSSFFPWLALKRDGSWRASSAVITALTSAAGVSAYLVLARYLITAMVR